MIEAAKTVQNVTGLHVTGQTAIGLNIVARSLKLAPGDEVLATDHQYCALDRPDLHSWVIDFHTGLGYTEGAAGTLCVLE